jgi:hypothetical protein
MELIGSYHASGYTVEAYFPEPDAPAVWRIWIVRDGKVAGEFTARIAVDSVYGLDHRVMVLLEAAADAAVKDVVRREAAREIKDEVTEAA